MKAIYTTVNDRKTFIGKHIEDTIVREFPFNTAMLWQKESLSFDKRLLAYAEVNGIKTFAFTDPKRGVRLEVSLETALAQGSEEEYGEETQWYIPKSAMIEVGYYKTAYVTEEVVL
jgi:hypothetical protein